MGKFTSTSDHKTAITAFDLPKGGDTRLHLVGVKARVSSDIKLKFKQPKNRYRHH